MPTPFHPRRPPCLRSTHPLCLSVLQRSRIAGCTPSCRHHSSYSFVILLDVDQNSGANTNTSSQNLPILRILGVYTVSLLAFVYLYSQIDETYLLNRLFDHTAEVTGMLLRLLGADVITSGNVVHTERFGLRIVGDCTSLGATAIFVSGILAFPARPLHMTLGVILGVAILAVVNLVRTSSLFLIGLSFPSALDTAHILVWQSIMVLLAVSIWILWWRTLVYRAR